MASIERDVVVELHIFGLPRQAGVARVRERDPRERTVRALQGAGLCLLGAAVSIPLVIVHFVLVPGFLIAAPIVALRRLREGASIVGLAGTCPRCGEERDFEAKGAFKAGIRTACPVCSFAIDVAPAAGAADAEPA